MRSRISLRSSRATDLSMLEQNLLERRRGLEEEDQHSAAIGRDRRVATSLGADDEIASGAFALVVAQRAFQNEGLLQILVHVRGDAGAGLELGENGQHFALRIVINDLHLAARRGRDPWQRFGLDEARGKRVELGMLAPSCRPPITALGVSLRAGPEAVHWKL